MIRKLNRENIECRQVLLLLDDFISEELSVESSRQILAHLENCQECRAEKNFREEVRQRARSAYLREPIPAGLERSIRRSLGRARLFEPWVLAVAASILIPVIGVLILVLHSPQGPLGQQPTDHFSQVALDHLNCKGHPTDQRELEPVLHQIESVLKQVGNDLKLAEVMECYLTGEVFFHYVFRDGSSSISLMIERRSEQETLPPDLYLETVAGTELYAANRSGVLLVSFFSPDHLIYLVGEDLDRNLAAQMAGQIAPVVRLLAENSRKS